MESSMCLLYEYTVRTLFLKKISLMIKHFKSYELAYRFPSVISPVFLPTISMSLNVCQLKELNTFSHKPINRYIQFSV